MVRWHIFWIEFMEADVEAVVAGFVTGKVFPLSYSCLQGVEGSGDRFLIRSVLKILILRVGLEFIR